MPTLIDRSGPREDAWIDLTAAGAAPLPTGTALPAGAGILLTLAQWQGSRDAWLTQPARIGVVLGPADDPAELAGHFGTLSLIAVAFPTFTDGRGYSSARLLRERHGWAGELRAVGEVLRDQLFYLARSGFDSFALADGQPVEEALQAFADFGEAYQAAFDRGPLFSRRGAGDAASVGGPAPGART